MINPASHNLSQKRGPNTQCTGQHGATSAVARGDRVAGGFLEEEICGSSMQMVNVAGEGHWIRG